MSRVMPDRSVMGALTKVPPVIRTDPPAPDEAQLSMARWIAAVSLERPSPFAPKSSHVTDPAGCPRRRCRHKSEQGNGCSDDTFLHEKTPGEIDTMKDRTLLV